MFIEVGVRLLILADLRCPMDMVCQQGHLHHKSWGLVHDWDRTSGQRTVQQVPLRVTGV